MRLKRKSCCTGTQLDGKIDYGTVDDIEAIIENLGTIQRVQKKNRFYYNIPCAFDIETSSFYENDEFNQLNSKVGIMYEWTFGIGGEIIIGRTWEEFLNLCERLVRVLNLNKNLRLIVYVHNLSFEFQFIKDLFDWADIFSLEKRKPIQALTEDGIEFRCSYLLSGYALRNLSKNISMFQVKKLDGDLDYKKIRHSKTPLTYQEIHYCINDVLVVMCYIYELMCRYKNIAKLPLTKTGFVRNYCRQHCFYSKDRQYDSYHNLIRSLTLKEDDYSQLKRAFMGGFTHASARYSRKILKNVDSFDFTSSYPYVMISEKFPMSSPKKVVIHSNKEFEYYIKNYCCLFDVLIKGVQSIELENYISSSRCWKLINPLEDNGRIVSADEIGTTITEQDYQIIKRMYKWEDLIVANFRIFEKAYLPKDFVLSILTLYKDKTELKGIESKYMEYMIAKENLNSCYGMCVTDICRDEISYNKEWKAEKPDITEALEKYNKSRNRFLYYPWGVWVTAYARKNLFTGICAIGEDYIYADTDSLKILNYEKHKDYFYNYNNLVVEKLKLACQFHGIDFNLTCPKNKYGEPKQLGIWTYETEGNIYTRFKTLGAKRYLVEQDGEYHLTVSGVSKERAISYMLSKRKDPFNQFDDNLCIPKGYSGKNIVTYIDEEKVGFVTDYLGNTNMYHEMSGVHLDETDYNLSLSDKYIEFLLGIEEHWR